MSKLERLFMVVIIFYSQLSFGQNVEGIVFKSFIEEQLASFPMNCEVAIGIIDGDMNYTFGYQRGNGKLIGVDNKDTLFQIGSISKTFTASLLMRGVQRGTIALNDPLQKHLTTQMKRDSFEHQTILIRHLATHTSGLKRNPIKNYKAYDNYLRHFKLDYVPGQEWVYNNLTFSLLGTILKNEDQTSWKELLRQNLLEPLEMNHTYVNNNDAPVGDRVKCVKEDGSKGGCYFEPLDPFMFPAGGIVSDISDMMKWLHANINKTSHDSSLDFIQASHDALGDSIVIPWFDKKYTQGIGWWHYKASNDLDYICHGGNMAQQTSFMSFNKDKRRGVIILTNVSGAALMNEEKAMKTTKLALQILDL